jgi:DNA-binding GntR family transcriptional regulator
VPFASKLRQVDTTALHERVYQALRTSIVRGHFVPGQQITIRDLARQLGTSAMPVRDALTRLVAERAIEMPSARAFRIPLLTRREFVELCEFRILVECNAVSLAHPMTAEELDRVVALDREITSHFRARKFEATLDANAEFHFTIYRASRRAVLVSHIESLWLQSGPYLVIRIRQMADDPAYKNRKFIGHHQELLTALRDRDFQAAAAALERDITETMMSYLPEAVFPA